MGNRSSLLLRDEEIAQIQKETGFTPNQIERLYSRFTSLDREDCGGLSREDLLRIPELAINPIGERIVDLFFEECGATDRANFRQFMHVLKFFRPLLPGRINALNSREQKIKFAFRVYDIDNDGFISKDELTAIVRMMVGDNISEEKIGHIVETVISKADEDGDGMISLDEYRKIITKDTDVAKKMSIRFLN